MVSRLLVASLLFSALTLSACSSEEEADGGTACTDVGCDCVQTSDCGAGLTCSPVALVCVASSTPDVVDDIDAGEDDTEDIAEVEDTPAPDVAPDILDENGEIARDACLSYCETRTGCGFEPVPGFTGTCEQICVEVGVLLQDVAASALDPAACDTEFRAFLGCIGALEACDDVTAAEDGAEGAPCTAEKARREAACAADGEGSGGEGSGGEGSGGEGSGGEGSGGEGSGA
jgi:hypothetical protein